jgi:hypothetical protein
MKHIDLRWQSSQVKAQDRLRPEYSWLEPTVGLEPTTCGLQNCGDLS